MRHRSPIFLAAIFIFGDLCSSQSKSDVSLIATDIENFWRAYDGSQPGSRREAFQTQYFNQASQGLKDFIAIRIGSAAALANTVDRYPKYYASIRCLFPDRTACHRRNARTGGAVYRDRSLFPRRRCRFERDAGIDPGFLSRYGRHRIAARSAISAVRPGSDRYAFSHGQVALLLQFGDRRHAGAPVA